MPAALVARRAARRGFPRRARGSVRARPRCSSALGSRHRSTGTATTRWPRLRSPPVSKWSRRTTFTTRRLRAGSPRLRSRQCVPRRSLDELDCRLPAGFVRPPPQPEPNRNAASRVLARARWRAPLRSRTPARWICRSRRLARPTTRFRRSRRDFRAGAAGRLASLGGDEPATPGPAAGHHLPPDRAGAHPAAMAPRRGTHGAVCAVCAGGGRRVGGDRLPLVRRCRGVPLGPGQLSRR